MDPGESLGFRLGPAHPNKPIRFAVGQPGERSTVWRLWANSNKSDVYLGSRKSADIFKISLHESEDWRQQWVNRDRKDVIYSPIGGEPEPEGRIASMDTTFRQRSRLDTRTFDLGAVRGCHGSARRYGTAVGQPVGCHTSAG
jgi:hypothetical protein